MPVKYGSNKIFNLNNLFWITYIGLLVVMLPHTTFVAEQVFSDIYTAIAVAVVFELSIFGFSVAFKSQIEDGRRLRRRRKGDNVESRVSLGFRKLNHTYFNVYFMGLIVTSVLSGLANFTYAVEFFGEGNELKIIEQYNMSPTIFHVGFGLILPVIAVFFTFVLAERISLDDTDEISQEAEQIISLKEQLIVDEKQITRLTQQLKQVKIYKVLHDHTNKEQRLVAAFTIYPKLNNSGASIIARCDPSYVTMLKKQWGDNGGMPEVHYE